MGDFFFLNGSSCGHVVGFALQGDSSINWNESVERLVAHVLRRVEVGYWTIDSLVTIAYGLEQVHICVL